MFSVILPVYNVEKYIGGCIKSLIGQTYRNFEVIVVNDGSPDKSKEIAERLLSDSNLSYKIIDTENHGVSSARNTGIRNSSGEYFITVDSDDVLSPDFLGDFARLADKYNKSDIIICDYSVVSHNCGFDGTACAESVYEKKDAQIIYDKRIIKFLLPAIMIKRDYAEKNNIWFDEDVRYSEDVKYIWRLLSYTSENIVYLPKKNYNYILHPNSTMTASGVKKILTGCSGAVRLYDEIAMLLTPQVQSGFVGKWMIAMLHGASKMLNFSDYLTLLNESNATAYIKSLLGQKNKIGILALLTVYFKRVGYVIMRKI